ncbi:MAG: glycosyltransferase family 4 protein [Acidobacteria bacterium]|nr:glycosyltransferase family 4 protein [Acidobacteriota bacterium]
MRQAIYAWDYLEWGGAQIHLFAIIREVEKHFRVSIVLPAGSDPKLLKFIDDLGVERHFFDGAIDTKPQAGLIGSLRSRIKKLRTEYRMMRRIAELRPDGVIHLDLLPHYSLLPLMWACLYAEVFITSHNRMPEVGWLREAIWRVKAAVISRFRNFHVLCSNEDAKKYFSRHYSKRTADDIQVTYTSINPDEIAPIAADAAVRQKARQFLSIQPEETAVLCVGNFIDRKGRWVFLEAARIAANENSSLKFVWLSPLGPDNAAAKRIDSFGLGDRFRLVLSDEIGKERSDVLGFFMLADIFVLPSYVEGLPIALLEAMALGLPAISTDVNAIPEAVIHEKTGLLVQPGDAETLANEILRLADDKAMAEKLAAAGKLHVIENFDERDVARKVLSAYTAALGETKALPTVQ